MKTEEIKTEFKVYDLTENEIISVNLVYKSIANGLLSLAGENLAFKPLILKLTMNHVKLLIINILELRDEFKERSRP